MPLGDIGESPPLVFILFFLVVGLNTSSADKRIAKRMATSLRCTIPKPAKPVCLYLVTDSKGQVQTDKDGNFDTGADVTGPWNTIVTLKALDDHLSSSVRSSIFISVVDDEKEAYKEHRRRVLIGLKDVKIHCIDVSAFVWEYVELGNTRFPVLRSLDCDAALFSTDSATQALNWWDYRMNSKEWFAVTWIPGSIVSLLEGKEHGT